MPCRLHDGAQSIASAKRSEICRRCTAGRSITSRITWSLSRRVPRASKMKIAMNEEPKEPARVGQGMDYGEQADVQQVHAAVQREKREPRVGAEPLSIWLIAIYGLAIFFGGAYLGRYSGNFTSGGLDPMGSPPAPKKAVAGGAGGGEQAELSPRDRGKKIFAANCQTCHQANGLGVPGQYPPLAGSEFTNGGS